MTGSAPAATCLPQMRQSSSSTCVTSSRVDLGDSLSAEVDLQRGLDGKTVLYLMAEGVLTAALARTSQPELLNAADMLDGLLQ